MKRQINFKLLALGAMLSSLLLFPTFGQAKEGNGGMHQEWKAKLAKELKLSPEKEKRFAAVADKYAKVRKDIYEGLKKSQGELESALAAPKPEEAKIRGLVKVITAAQDKLLTTYKSERNDEMAVLSVMEQGHYLEILHKWRTEMYEKHRMTEQKKGETEPQKGEPEKK
jgi:Spy/CpxP family protein refolding chaperone